MTECGCVYVAAARGTVCYRCREDNLQHHARHFSTRVHVRGYRRSAVQGAWHEISKRQNVNIRECALLGSLRSDKNKLTGGLLIILVMLRHRVRHA